MQSIHLDYDRVNMIEEVRKRTKEWLSSRTLTVPPEILLKDYLHDMNGSDDEELLGTDKAATYAERLVTSHDLERSMDRVRPLTLVVQRNSDVKRNIQLSRISI